MLPDVAPLGFVQDSPDIVARVTGRFDQADEIVDQLLEEDIVFPQRVIRIDQNRVPFHLSPSQSSQARPRNVANLSPSDRSTSHCFRSRFRAGEPHANPRTPTAPSASQSLARPTLRRLGRTGGQLLENSRRKFLRFTEIRQVALEFAIQLPGLLGSESGAQDHVPQPHRMRQKRFLFQFVECGLRVIVIHRTLSRGRILSLLPWSLSARAVSIVSPCGAKIAMARLTIAATEAINYFVRGESYSFCTGWDA